LGRWDAQGGRHVPTGQRLRLWVHKYGAVRLRVNPAYLYYD